MERRKVDVMIKHNLGHLTRQQVKTLRGLLNAGEVEGAYKGLIKLLRRKQKELKNIA